MTDKVTIQPKSKPEKTTISISGETSERLENRLKSSRFFRKKTTDCVTKSKFFRSIKKKHTGNFAGYVTNRKLSEK